MIEFIITNWILIVALLTVLFIVGYSIYKYAGLPTFEQRIKIRAWLLQAVIIAEKELGSGTGKAKLSMVYDAFVLRFPSVSKLMSFKTFNKLVDSALEDMIEILKTNDRLIK